MSKMRLFVPLQKVDEEQRLVYGILTQEVLDKSGETFDYEGSKPFFEKWSDGISKASGGKSVGNMRVMHTNKVAGIFTDMTFNDSDKAIEVCGKVVDDQEWELVKAGAYTGFSIGGRYVKRFEVDGARKFIADPAEGSLVDNPCVPTATFAVVKADGSTSEAPFQLWSPTNDQLHEVAQSLAKAAGAGEWADFIEPAREALLKAKAEEDEKDDEDESDAEKDDEKEEDGGDQADKDDGKGDKKSKKAAAPSGEAGDWEQVWKTKDGETFATKAEAVAHAGELKAIDATGKLTSAVADLKTATTKADSGDKKPYGDVEYADAKNNKYPVDTAKHIRAAWSYINMPKNQKNYTSEEVSAIKAKIVKAWKDKIDKDGPPSAEKMAAFGDSGLDVVCKVLIAVDNTAVSKGLYTVGRTAHAMSCLADIACSVVWEERMENDADSNLPQQAADLLSAFRTFLIEMVNEETAELLTNLKSTGGEADIEIVIADPNADIMELCTQVMGLAKADNDFLAKAGARNSKADQDRIQAVHDHSMTLGAKCNSGNCDKADEGEMNKMVSLEAENATYKRLIDDLTPQMETLKKQVETLLAQPLPAAPRTHVVGKGEDNGGPAPDGIGHMTADQLLEKFGPDELAKAAIKISQRTPMAMVPGNK